MKAKEKDEEASAYQDDIDLAFFVVNLGMSISDARSLTGREKAFIYKEFENKLVRDSQLMNMAVGNAITNAFRKKGKRLVPLWRKAAKKLDATEAREKIKAIERDDDKSWLDKIKRKR